MRKSLLLLVLLPMVAVAQVKIPKGANRFTYYQFEYGEKTDTTVINVAREGDIITILTDRPQGELIQGYCQTETSVDYAADSITVTATYPDSVYYYRTRFSRNDIEWKREGAKYTCSINSNTLVFEMDEKAPVNVNPLPYYGLNKGVLRSFTRNGQKRLVLAKAEKVDDCMASIGLGNQWSKTAARRVSPRELDRIMKERLVVTTRIFDHEQICWGKKNAPCGGVRCGALRHGAALCRRHPHPQARQAALPARPTTSTSSRYTSAATATPTTARVPSSSFCQAISASISCTASTSTPTRCPPSLAVMDSAIRAWFALEKAILNTNGLYAIILQWS